MGGNIRPNLWYGASPTRALLTALLFLALAACRTAQNHLDPRAPFHSAAYGEARPEARQPRSGGRSLRIVTFNIEYALRVDQALVALRDHPRLDDADLIALQEMDAAGTDRIARALGLNYVYYPASVHPKHKRDVGNAILTPWTIESSVKLPLPHTSRILGQARAAVGAIVVVGDRRLRVYSLHLGSPFGASPGQRRDQIDVVLCHAREGAEPVVVAGDLNSSRLGGRLEADGYSWLTRGVGATTRRFSFDHVFIRGLPFAAAEAGVARDVKDASDHRPVWADVDLTEAPGQGIQRQDPEEDLQARPAARRGPAVAGSAGGEAGPHGQGHGPARERRSAVVRSGFPGVARRTGSEPEAVGPEPPGPPRPFSPRGAQPPVAFLKSQKEALPCPLSSSYSSSTLAKFRLTESVGTPPHCPPTW